MQVFVSFSSKDQSLADAFVEKVRLHYIDCWYSPRTMPGGYFEPNIRAGLQQSHRFVVLISPDAIRSDWVRREVAMAMSDDRLRNRIYPVLIRPTDNWTELHEHLGKLQCYDLSADPEEAWHRLLYEEFKVDPHKHPYYRVGDITVQVHRLVGGDGMTRYRRGDIECEGPGRLAQRTDAYRLPEEIAADADERIVEMEVTAKAKEQVLVNNPQVRLCAANWGSPRESGGIDNRPLRLSLGWTEYYHTRLTNMQTDRVLDDGLSLGQKYAGPLESLHQSRLSNPIATNMSVVTSDRMIYVATRGTAVSWNSGGFQPAISGDGQPEDLDDAGIYDPFRTAVREGMEECFGQFRPDLDAVTFFGLARTMKTRFPFLFGEIRLPITSQTLESYPPLNTWEGQRVGIPFTVEAVTEWIDRMHRDQVQGRRKGVLGTTLFSLLQSLHYEFPARWPEIIERLTTK